MKSFLKVASAAVLASVSMGLPLSASAQEVNLRMTALHGQVATGIQAAWDEYKKTHPNVNLTLEVQTDENNFRSTAPATIFSSGGPDLSWWWCARSYQWNDMIDAGMLAPLDDVWTEEGFSDSLKNSFTNTDGMKYGIPQSGVYMPVVYYNKTLFTELGLDAPKTWDELFAAADAVRGAGYQPLATDFDTNLNQQFANLAMMRGFTAEEYETILTNWTADATEEQKAVKWSDPNGVAVFELLKRVADEGLLADGYAGQSDRVLARSMFTSGKAAMYQNNSGDANSNLDAAEFEVGYFFYPREDEKQGAVASFFANCYIVFNQSPNIDAAKDFVRYLTSAEGMMVATKASGLMPSRNDFSGEELSSAFSPLLVSLIQEAGSVPTPPFLAVKLRPDLLSEIKRYAGEVLTGVTSPVDAANGLQALWEQARTE